MSEMYQNPRCAPTELFGKMRGIHGCFGPSCVVYRENNQSCGSRNAFDADEAGKLRQVLHKIPVDNDEVMLHCMVQHAMEKLRRRGFHTHRCHSAPDFRIGGDNFAPAYKQPQAIFGK
jgi:hypothetical protein